MEKTILVADDDRNIIDIVKAGLVSEGFKVITAYDGRTALDLMKLHKPDLSILDINMPNIDGFSLEAEAREDEEFKRMPVIIMTGQPELRTMFDKTRELKINAWFTKPFDLQQLLKKVKSVLSDKNRWRKR